MIESDWRSECCGARLMGGKCSDCFENCVGEEIVSDKVLNWIKENPEKTVEILMQNRDENRS